MQTKVLTHLLHLSLHRHPPLLSRGRKPQEREIDVLKVDLSRDGLVECRERRTDRFDRYYGEGRYSGAGDRK